MLTAAVAAAALLAGSTADGAAPKPSAVFAVEDSSAGYSLVRLAPATLAETGRIFVGAYPGFHAFSPDRTKLALADAGNLSFFDSRSLRETGRLPVRSVRRLVWPRPRLMLAMTSDALLRIDPSVPRVLQMWPIEPLWFYTVAGGRIVGVPQRWAGASQLVLGDRVRLRFLSSSGPQSVLIERLRLAVEDWRVRPGAILPPLASEGVAKAQADLSQREGVPLGEIAAVSVAPFQPVNNLVPGGQYEVVLSARGEYFSYRVFMCCPGVSVQFRSQLPGPPAPTETDILHAPIGTWEVSSLNWAVDPVRHRAYAITPESVFVEVDLRKARVRLRPLARKVGALGWRPAFLGSGTIALPTCPITLLDVRSARLRRLGSAASGCERARFSIEPAGHRFVVPGSVTGIRIFDARGRLLHRLLTRNYVSFVQVGGPYAYARFVEGEQGKIGVVDLRQGRVVRTVTGLQNLVELLTGP